VTSRVEGGVDNEISFWELALSNIMIYDNPVLLGEVGDEEMVILSENVQYFLSTTRPTSALSYLRFSLAECDDLKQHPFTSLGSPAARS
jgi:hypothetical protein